MIILNAIKLLNGLTLIVLVYNVIKLVISFKKSGVDYFLFIESLSNTYLGWLVRVLIVYLSTAFILATFTLFL